MGHVDSSFWDGRRLIFCLVAHEHELWTMVGRVGGLMTIMT
jgi:hypothetical protein